MSNWDIQTQEDRDGVYVRASAQDGRNVEYRRIINPGRDSDLSIQRIELDSPDQTGGLEKSMMVLIQHLYKHDDQLKGKQAIPGSLQSYHFHNNRQVTSTPQPLLDVLSSSLFKKMTDAYDKR